MDTQVSSAAGTTKRADRESASLSYWHAAERVVWGTTATLLVTESAAQALATKVLDEELDRIGHACSRFSEDSELAMLNRAAGQRVTVSTLLFEAVEVALRVAEATEGLVDPTVGTSLRLIGYDRDFAAVQADGPPLGVSLLRIPGWQAVELHRAPRTIRVPEGVVLDLGATAKAWAADRIAERALLATGSGLLVSLGGDIAIRGTPPAGGWSIRIAEEHLAAPGPLDQTISLGCGGIATSSTTTRRWQRGGRLVHHIIDPTSGGPARVIWRTSSVAGASCVDANAGATAAIILGERAPAWLSRHGLPARLVKADGTVMIVGDWPEQEP